MIASSIPWTPPCPRSPSQAKWMPRKRANSSTNLWVRLKCVLVCKLFRESLPGFAGSFATCSLCFPQMMEAHLSRDKAIKACIAQTSELVGHLREERATDSENLAINKQLRKAQTKVRPVFNNRMFRRVLNYVPVNKKWDTPHLAQFTLRQNCHLTPALLSVYKLWHIHLTFFYPTEVFKSDI